MKDSQNISTMMLLGAGSPHKGLEHSALHVAFENNCLLDWLLHLASTSNLKPVFVGGYQLDSISALYPSLEIISNSMWSDTKSAYSFLQSLKGVAGDVVVTYTDILYRSDLLANVQNISGDVVVALDTNWKTRFVGRSQNDQILSEKACINGNAIMRLGLDISIDKANAEFIGLVKFSKDMILHLMRNYERYILENKQTSLSELIETLRIEGFQVRFVDVEGEWAELNQPEDLAHFILGTKAQTLNRLQSIVKFSRIEDQVSFTLAEWDLNRQDVINQIRVKFNQGTVVIRSSAVTEDGFNESNAGAYTSLLNIHTDAESLTFAIETVIASYPDKNIENQVLVQPMLQNVKASGVVFTRVLNTGAPYYVVNYDDVTGSTESITSGSAIEHKTLLMRRDAKPGSSNIPEKLLCLLPALRELEGLLNYTALDIEFALTDLGLHILQVRPIAVAKQVEFDESLFYKTLEQAKQAFTQHQFPSPFVGQSKAIFGVMPDWNPAEIIGTKPAALATSLYQDLVMNETWATQRAEYGYHDVRSHGLLVNFAGHPYVDIRASFTSFIPKNVSLKLRDKLVAFYIQWLEMNPHLHDKVEFDVIPTCYALDFDRWCERLTEQANLTQDEIETLEQGLKTITHHAFERVEQDLENIQLLNQRYSAIQGSQANPLTKANLLIEDCKRYGTLPFAHLARAGFIAVTLLKSAVSKSILSQEAFDDFMAGIRTVSHQLSEDAQAVRSGHLEWQAFVDKYAHLRPGTYDITSESYGANPEYYLRPLIDQTVHGSVHTRNKAWQKESKMFVSALNEVCFDLNATTLEKFLHQAIEGREYAKFMFSRNLSTALDLIRDWGMDNSLNVTDLAYLQLNEILHYKDQPILDIDAIKQIKSQVETRKTYYRLNKSIELPPLICSEQDFDIFQYPCSQANFVGSKTVMAECLELSKCSSHSATENLAGLIVMIPQADPGYDWLFGRNIAGLVTMYGGANSHMAIRAAEFGLPASIGIGEARYQELSTATVLEINPSSRQLKVIR